MRNAALVVALNTVAFLARAKTTALKAMGAETTIAHFAEAIVCQTTLMTMPWNSLIVAALIPISALVAPDSDRASLTKWKLILYSLILLEHFCH